MRPKIGEGSDAANPKLSLAFQERIYLLPTLFTSLSSQPGKPLAMARRISERTMGFFNLSTTCSEVPSRYLEGMHISSPVIEAT